MSLIPPIPNLDTIFNSADRYVASEIDAAVARSSINEMEIPDLTRFMRHIENNDLARPNMFIVRFGDFRSTIFNDGVLGVDSPIRPDTNGGTSVFDDLFSGTSYTWHRIQDVALGTANRFLNDSMKKLLGAYDPSLIRTIPGAGEVLDAFLGLNYDINKDLAMMVKSVNLPSSTIETSINRNDRTPWHEARSRTTGNITMTFYCSPNYEERSLMLAWQNAINDPKSGRWGFYDAYARDIDILTLDRHGVKKSLCHSTGCYPINVGEVQLDFDNNSQVSVFTVEFAVATSIHIPNSGDENSVDSLESIIRRVNGIYNAVR